MASFQRYALALALAATALLAFGDPTVAHDSGTVRLELADPPGGLRIVNDGTAPGTIQLAIVVEKQEAVGWVPIATEFNAVARCDPPGSVTTATIPPLSALNVRPWRGFSCSGQCNFVCRANVYYGKGMFRFVVTAMPALHRITSTPFAMPAEPLR
jgi:hypothetical protein